MLEIKETEEVLGSADTIEIHQFIVHEVYWQEMSNQPKQAKVHTRDEVNDINSMSKQVARELGNLFNQTSLAAGMFTSEKSVAEGDFPRLPTAFERYLSEDLNSNFEFPNFVDFTKKSTKDFATNFFGKTGNATPGYLLFFQHSFHGKHYLSIVMLHKTKGMTLNQSLDLTESEQLDLSTLHLAARINLSIWKDQDRFDDERYIRFKTGRKAAEVRAYFSDFIGCHEYLEAKTDTNNLLKAVEYLSQRLEYDIEQIGEKLQQAKSFCIDSLNLDDEGRISLDPFSKAIFPDNHTDFVELAQSDEFGISEKVGIDRRTLNQGMRLSGKSDNLTISFVREALKSDIEFVPSREHLVIKKIPADLLATLKQNLEAQE